MSDPILIERLSKEAILVQGPPSVVAIATTPGPFGPIANVPTTVAVLIDGAGSVVTIGQKASLPINWNGTITGWELIADIAGNTVIDILKGDPVNSVPFVSIVGSNKPTLTAVAAAVGNVSGWNPVLAPGDVLRFDVQSLSTIRRLTIALFVERD